MGCMSMIARHVKSMQGQEIKGRQSSLGNISHMREIITPGGRRTRLREIPECSIKLREAPAECGRVDSSGSRVVFFHCFHKSIIFSTHSSENDVHSINIEYRSLRIIVIARAASSNDNTQAHRGNSGELNNWCESPIVLCGSIQTTVVV